MKSNDNPSNVCHDDVVLETTTFLAMPGHENQPKEARPHWIERILRYTPFSLVVTTSFLLIACFPLWMWLDAHYRHGLYFTGINLGFNDFGGHPSASEIGLTELILQYANEWSGLGARIKLFYLLFILAFASGVLVVAHLWNHWTPRRGAIALLLAAGWLGLYFTHPMMTHWAVKRHALTVLPRAKLATAFLITQWPDRSCRIPPDLDVISVPEKYPNYLLVQGQSGYPMRERIGFQIERSEIGVLRYGLAAAVDYNLEYHPPPSYPSSYRGSTREHLNVMKDWIAVEENWYLVRYLDM